ncbi:iron transport system exported solute-binding protein [Corynebacterium diphtheriae]|nr:iron transport system exported solute-binding protein [Corynebacterium diphtheriae]CAB0683430.1 iron transport system exported solute-binding protein [Corynebacterium diphtheriae]CAB0685778.1 iron transport system exported solute-binding protein [Corynebacterium diphtheriae]CAB0686468.1 iron transport system exported solute-binding protein [Corynebacterium diphtheriae]CAB0721764.1 iron transport system exported solute-binding protein [Corynebacterium diphtheriae]
MKSKLFPLLVPVLSTAVVLTSCGQSDEPQQSAADNGVTVTNCGKEMTYAQADNLFVNDANIISMVLSVGDAEDVVEGSPSFEAVVAKPPDIFIGGWNSGMSEEKSLTPDSLKGAGD